MSWGQGSEAATQAGQATQTLDLLNDGGKLGGSTTQSLDLTSKTPSAPAAGGYSMQVEPQSAFSGASGYEVAEDGTKTPVGGSVMDGSVAEGLGRFQKGGEQGIRETYNNFGNNPETYGAAYGMINRMAGSGKQSPSPAMTTNINYQQPTNPYLAKRGRY